MPLKVSIDVDLTILDENQKLIPGVREILSRLHAAKDSHGERLYEVQLWSACGAKYAKDTAKTHGLTDYFDSFAAKPDVVVDDLPFTTLAKSVIRVDPTEPITSALKSYLASAGILADVVHDQGHDLLCEIMTAQSRAQAIAKKFAAIKRANVPFHPIPFFGNITTASVVTVGLNPSSGEFESWRNWPEVITPENLLLRLTGYFHSKSPPPHPWFAEYNEGLNLIGRSYQDGAAHIDVSPWPTLSPRFLRTQTEAAARLADYKRMLDSEISHLAHVLPLAKRLKLIIVLENQYTPANLRTILQKSFAGSIQYFSGRSFPEWIHQNQTSLLAALE